MILASLKDDFLAVYRKKAASAVKAIAAGDNAHQAKAKEVNALVNQIHEELKAGIAASRATTQDMSDFKVTARPAAVALGALTMAGRNNQDVMAR